MSTPQYNFTVTQLDLDFILKQIKIAEASTNPLTGAAENLPTLVGSALLPYGLRTVDGTWNNLLPGQERFGAADNIMPRLVAAHLRGADLSPAAFGPQVPTSYTQTSGNVFDSQPRVASNLISDQTVTNPAAVAAALQLGGNANPTATAQTVVNAFATARAADAALKIAQTADASAAATLATIQTGSSALLTALSNAQAANTTAQNNKGTAATALSTAQGTLSTEAGQLLAAQSAATTASGNLTATTISFNDANSLKNSTADTAATNQGISDAALANSTAKAGLATSANATAATALATYNAAVTAASAGSPAVATALNNYSTAVTTANTAHTAVTTAQTAAGVAGDAAATSAQASSAAASAQPSAVTLKANALTADTAAQATLTTELGQYTTALTAVNTAANALLAANTELGLANTLANNTAAQALADEILPVGDPVRVASALAATNAAAALATAHTTFNTAFGVYNTAQGTLTIEQGQFQAAQLAASATETALNQATNNLVSANALVASTAAQSVLDAAAFTNAQGNITNANSAAATADADKALAFTAYNDAVAAFAPDVATTLAAYNTSVSVSNAATLTASTALDAYNTAHGIAAGSTQAADAAAATLTLATTAHDNAVSANTAAQALVVAEQADSLAATMAVNNAQTSLDTLTGLAAATAAALATAENNASAVNSNLNTALDNATAAHATFLSAQGLSTSTHAGADNLVTTLGLEISPNGTILIENRSPDIGLSPSFNGWMTFFGQFFDHGLDLVTKGNNGTVFVPLLPDDPLYVVGSQTNFMVLSRATQVAGPGPDGILVDNPNTAVNEAADNTSHESINTTTPYIDQNQTYTSHPSHQVFLREYQMVDGKPLATGHLLNGAHGEANWGETKIQAAQLLGIQLVDTDVVNVPLLATDRYGEFIRGPHGFAQFVTAHGLVEGDPAANGGKGVLLTPDTVRTDHQFLVDIAHGAAPGFFDNDHNPATAPIALVADSDNTVGSLPNPNYNPALPVGPNNSPILPQAFGTYDDELLARHFITGDGRGNENIGLTTVHSVFHSEHNRLIEDYKQTILGNGNLATLNEWLLTDLTALPTTTAQISALQWDGERLFQAGRFITEMQYQHLVFEEFARAVQPAVNPFVFSNSPDINPAIVAEFAHVVYRFGHSMLQDNVTRTDFNNVTTDQGLIAVFLNPLEFDKNGAITESQAIGSLVRGMSHQTGNAIDEFITESVRNNLVGLPLDLATLNMARARDTGMPSFNEARAAFFAASGQTNLKPFISWVDMVPELKHPDSIVNFIASYGTHSSITSAATLAGKRAAAVNLVFGDHTLTGVAADNFNADRIAFLNATGVYAGGSLGGVNNVDLWIGGLAERTNEFGGMLGATFNYVFENQLEKLQNGDRFYYISRGQGLNVLNELEANTFSKLVMRNSDLGKDGSSHVAGLLFGTPNYILEIDQNRQVGADPVTSDPILQALHPMVIRHAPGIDVNGDGKADGGYIQFTGGEHVVLGGTAGNDTIKGGNGIDTLWGDAGNDNLNGGNEADHVFGGDGNDIITDTGTPVGGSDFLYGDEGNDVISSGNGADFVFGGGGSDFLIAGDDGVDVTGGRGDDFMLGGAGTDVLNGNEGSDWIEGGEGLEALSGENSELFFNSPIIGNDVLNGQGNDTDYDGESGDDIMVEGPGIQRNNGMFGFDWGIHKDDPVGANSDLGIPIFTVQQLFTLRDRFDSVEGLSGWNHDDTLTGASLLRGGAAGFGAGPGNPVDESDLKAKNVNLIDGLANFLNITQTELSALIAQELLEEAVVPASPTARRSSSIIDITQGAEIIMGGGGNDTIRGNLGNDILDGDAWLNVRIRLTALGAENTQANELETFNSMNEVKARMLTGEINPAQLHIVREILQSTTAATDVDTAMYSGVSTDYDIIQNSNGTFTVTDNGNRLVNGKATNDGSDTIRNIENLFFQDITINLAEMFPINLPPVITSNGGGATAAVSVAENTTIVTTVVAVDPENAPLSYTITGGADQAKFTIDATTGALTFIASPNFEIPSDVGADNVYDLIVQASDGVLVDSQALAVTVTNVNEAPMITSNGAGATAAISINENTTAVTTVVATDVDVPTTLTYSISGGPDQAKFAINATTGVLTFITAPNFEVPTDVGTNNVYDVIVQASDGVLVDSQALAVTVINVNEASTGTVNITNTYSTTTAMARFNAANTIVDPDGVTSVVRFQWQSLVAGAWGNIAGATTASLGNLSTTLNNSTVRVTSSYADPFGSYTIPSVETGFVGNEFSNTIVGTAQKDIILGLNSNDTLTGGAGNDVVDGGFGDDRIIATVNDGNDTYIGGGTIDTYDLAGTSAAATVNLSTGTATSLQTGTDTLNTIENVTGSSGNDIITAANGANLLNGVGGNDTFIMTVDDAVDDIRGGTGADTIDYSVYVSNLSVTLNGITPATFTGSGVLNNDVIREIENFTGGSGNDSITGDANANRLIGGAGNDTLNGGLGVDTLTGGLGSDTFNYGLPTQSGLGVAARDVITDFISGADKLNFSGIDADTLVAGDQAFSFNTIAGAAISAAGQLVFHYEGTGANEITVVQGNVNAAVAPDFEVALLGHMTFNQATDIVL